jgi:hypothetical protein
MNKKGGAETSAADSASRQALSQLVLDDLEYKPWDPLPGRDSRDYYEKRMNAGDTFRASTRIGASMAALAVREIAKHRSRRAKGGQPVASRCTTSSRIPRVWLTGSIDT